MEHHDRPVGPVVVGVDGSEQSHVAVRWAAEEATRRRAPLRVVHVWPAPSVGWPWPLTGVWVDPAPYQRAAEALVDDAADRLRAELGDRAPLVETRTVEGAAVTGLTDSARDADLLVVGSRGRGGFASLALGSVAAGCAHRSPVPLAVVAHDVPVELVEPADDDRPIVVGVDGSQPARTALRWAAREAALCHRRLLVVHGWEHADVDHPTDGGGVPDLDDRTGRGATSLEHAVAEALEGVEHPPTVELRLERESPARALVAASETAALLVVGTRGRGSFGGLVLGSVSQQCVHHAASPVVVVPPEAEAIPPSPAW